MSKTYNSKHKFNSLSCNYEFPHGYNDNNMYKKTIEPGEEYDYDISHTTTNDWINRFNKCSRHPNKRKKRGSLGREFTKLGMTGTQYWRNRFGEEDNKSSRCRLVKHQMNQTRRHRIKNETQEIINNSLNEE